MNIEELKPILNNIYIEGNKICVNNNLHKTLAFLKDNYYYDMLKSITAVDIKNAIELIYNLYSTENEEEVLISVKVDKEAESVSDLYDSAIADENEIYDMFGVYFNGHENLKRLYMPENWDGYPLRKDYVQDDTRLAWNDNNDEA